MKKVSIIVPVYNAENTIGRCIQSLRTQTYENLEIYLIDDGSMDRSLSICERFQNIDQRIHVLHHENHGVSYTRNCGINMASGDFLMFVDGDDEILPEAIQTYVEAMESSKADVVIGGITVITENEGKMDKLPDNAGLYGKEIWNKICCDQSGLFGYVPNKLYNLRMIDGKGIRFNLEFSAQEDLDFALSVYNVCSKFCLIPYSGYLYYYAAVRKNHPYIQYIKNKVKMFERGNQTGCLTASSKEIILNNIEDQLYVALYYATDAEFKNICQELRNIDGFTNILKSKRGLHYVSRMFLLKRDKKLYYYFLIRKRIGHILHRT